jgi:hypothetical protein
MLVMATALPRSPIPPTAPTDLEAGVESVWRNHDFRLLLGMQTLAGLRGPILWFSQAWFVNAAAPPEWRVLLLGVLATANGTAFLAWALFGGALADRHPRRTTLMSAHALGAALVAATALVLALPGVEEGGAWFFLVIPLFASFGLMNAQDLPTRTALVADVVPARLLTAAITANWLAFALIMLVGNFLGGVLIDTLGFGPTYAMAALPHLGMVYLASRLRVRSGPADANAAQRSLLGNVLDGLAYLKTDAAVRWTVLLQWLAMVGTTSVLWTLGAAWMNEVMHIDAAGWSALTIFWSVGMITASAIMVRRGEYRSKGVTFIGAALLSGVAVVVYSFSRSAVLTGLAMMVVGMGFQTQQTVGTAILQTVVPRHLLGRITALLFLSQGLAQASGIAFGLLGQAVGLETLFPIVGVTMLAGALAIAVLQRPLRALD